MNAQTDRLIIQADSIALELTRGDIIIDPIETMPKFPGGQDSMKVFIERSNNWVVGQLTISGLVVVEATVETDGSLTNLGIRRSLHESCDKEALRIIKIMPNWIPAELDGIPLRTKIFIPIKFN